MREILEAIIDLIGRNERGAVASIVSASGSLPMSRRSKMLTMPDGSQRGTVGGGCLEADVHAMGRKVIESGVPAWQRFVLTESQAGAEGLNCGGTVEILIEPVLDPHDDTQAEIYRLMLDALQTNEEVVLATVISAPPSVSTLGKGLIGWKGLRIGWGRLGGDEPLTELAVEEGLAILGQDRATVITAPAGERIFLETISAPPTLYLFGGGHVSLSVARVARTAGFRVVVIDDRPAFANRDRFPEADEALVLPMESAMSRLPIDRNAYIVAVTRGHQHDEPVIEQAIRTPACYIGMIGSRRKVTILLDRLRSRGATPDQLDRIHAPIGLPIGADTPGEIAVSIVAQLISARRQSPR